MPYPEREIFPEQPERIPSPERKRETTDTSPSPQEPSVSLSPSVSQPEVFKAQDPLYQKIEDILEEDLESVYFDLPPQLQDKFKRKGEEVAQKIKKMLQQAKLKAEKVIELIKNWLKIIPGINRYFLEQEAKIKADKILKLKKD